ncbi:MAG: hypothetical protein J6W29_02590, partial [Neisseriaceae bacterium]|nr:hypothetical protein [Neisseriaceae bacterium]
MNNQAKNQLLDKIPLLKKEISYLFNHQYINEIKYEELSNRLNKLKTNKVLQENTVFYQTIHYKIKSLIYLIAFYFYRNNNLVKAIKLWQMIDENYIDFYQCKDYRNYRERNFSECNQKLYAQTQFNLGLIQRQRGNFNQAIKHYLNSKTQESYYNLANIYHIQNKKIEALKCLRKIKKTTGYIFSLSQMKLGDIYNEMQQYNMAKYNIAKYNIAKYNIAKSAYKEVVNIPNIVKDNEELYLYAHINLAVLYYIKKQY